MFWFFKKNKKETLAEQIPQQNNKKISSFFNKISNLFTSKVKPDDMFFVQLEKIFVEADFGYSLTHQIIDGIKSIKFTDNYLQDIEKFVFDIINNLLSGSALPFSSVFDKRPYVMVFCGVNGNGKTTTIAKIANKYKKNDMKVLIAACDTFRASAIEQLKYWADEISCDIFIGKEFADPASVAYSAMKKAVDEQYDLLLIDTAGRLHTQQNLIEELAKIIRIINKIDKISPDEVLLVLDSTTGQNALAQTEKFYHSIGVTGIVLTKFDGTSKSGTILNIIDKFKNIKIRAICDGEKIDSISNFDINKFYKKIGLDNIG